VSASRQLTWWSLEHNLTSSKDPAFTTESTQATHKTMMDESTTKRSLSSSDLSKTTEGKQTERRELTSVQPTNSKMEEKTAGNTQRVQTSEDVEPYSNVVTRIPLKYIIIASGSLIVLVFALLLLLYHLFTRRYVLVNCYYFKSPLRF